MKKKYLTWEDLFEIAKEKIPDLGNGLLYGVPKGGMLLAGFLAERFGNIVLATEPGEARFILDDIVDSGKTREYYQANYPDAEFISLIDRSDYEGEWIVFPWESQHPAGEESVQDNITRLLEYIGEDPSREGLQGTPDGVIRSYSELFSGYNKKPEDVMTTFDGDGYDEIVLLKDIELYSTCEHHMLPFYGVAHVAYIPNKKVIGLSKLARIVDIYARRLQIQERIGLQVTSALMEHLQPKGAACIIESKHMCMCSRGVEKQNSVMTTSSMKGVFFDDSKARSELLSLIS